MTYHNNVTNVLKETTGFQQKWHLLAWVYKTAQTGRDWDVGGGG